MKQVRWLSIGTRSGKNAFFELETSNQCFFLIVIKSPSRTCNFILVSCLSNK